MDAQNVEFFPKPNDEKDKSGNLLHSIYVNWGDQTQKEVETKMEDTRRRYANRKMYDIPDTHLKEHKSNHTKNSFRYSDPGEDRHPWYI